MPPRIAYKQIKDYPWILRVIFWIQKKSFGQVLNPTLLWGYSPWQSLVFMLFYKVLDRKSSPLSPELRSLAMVRVAQVHGCQYCIDINAMLLMERSGNPDKLLALQEWKTSPAFSQQEKWVLEYTEAMTQTVSGVTDNHMTHLETFLSSTQIVELTGLIAYQNMSARFNSALNVPAQGLCQLPKG